MQMRINRWYRSCWRWSGVSRTKGRQPNRTPDDPTGTYRAGSPQNESADVFAGQFYDLRGNIQFVRNRLLQNTPPK